MLELLKLQKIIDQMCLNFCPCCKSNKQWIRHWFIDCPFFNHIPSKVNDKILFLYNAFNRGNLTNDIVNSNNDNSNSNNSNSNNSSSNSNENENENNKLSETPINQSQINSYSYSNTELSNTPIAHSDKKSFSYSSITSNLSTPIPTKLSPHLNKPSYIDNSLNITNLKKSDPSSSPAPPHPLSSNSSSNVPVMLSSSKPSRSLRNINTRDEFLIRNKEKDDISAILNQALERINRNKQSFLSLSKTYSLRNNSEFNS